MIRYLTMNKAIWTRIRLEGNERTLQNLVCCDLKNIGTDLQWSALCGASGKVLSTAWIQHDKQYWFMDLPIALKTTVIEHLQRFALRDRFKIEEVSLPKDDRYQLRNCISHLTPCLEPHTSEQYTPQALGVDMIPNAISWTKGCYLGQEVIMRLQQLGQIKRVIKAFKYEGEIKTLYVTRQDGQNAGHIINHCNDQNKHLFSIIVSVNHGPLYINNQPIQAI